jgi:hypothetical protein
MGMLHGRDLDDESKHMQVLFRAAVPLATTNQQNAKKIN